uniref:GIY-YIG domain-containing protein n=1 Tax=Panagrellus redivivus TaxID=6233 RepID=A0A7E4UT43_PANRE
MDEALAQSDFGTVCDYQLQNWLQNPGFRGFFTLKSGPIANLSANIRQILQKSPEGKRGPVVRHAVFSAALDRAIRQSVDGLPKSDVGQIQEDIIRNEFCLGPSVTRETPDFSSYCYLLLDPSKVTNQQKCTFKEFISAIFYVGKGKGFRSRQHLFEAINAQPGGASKKPISIKQKRIQDIWKNGNGVIALHVFNNINPMEALIREAAMIDAFGLKNLTNQKGGEYSGLAKSWTLQEKTKFGVFCLQSAWGIFQHDRARPVFEAEVIEVYKQQKFYKAH